MQQLGPDHARSPADVAPPPAAAANPGSMAALFGHRGGSAAVAQPKRWALPLRHLSRVVQPHSPLAPGLPPRPPFFGCDPWLVPTGNATGATPDVVPHGGWPGGLPGDPNWGVAVVTVPWEVWKRTGNANAVHDAYEAVKMFVDFLDRNAANRSAACPYTVQRRRRSTRSPCTATGCAVLCSRSAVTGPARPFRATSSARTPRPRHLRTCWRRSA